MPLVSTSIPNLLNGVSQQPSPLRQVTQGETQVNAMSSVIDGLIKRPPTEHISQLYETFGGASNFTGLDKAAVHIIDRGEGFRHILVITATPTSSVLYRFGFDGTLQSRHANVSYFYCDNPSKELKFLTIADTTFILNTTITTSMNNNYYRNNNN